jgi:hypothetical protein
MTTSFGHREGHPGMGVNGEKGAASNARRPGDEAMSEFSEIVRRLDGIEAMLETLLRQHTVKDFYSTTEIAELLGKAEFTVREWCRLGRIRAQKRLSGRGPHSSWVISHEELVRLRREGLFPTERPITVPVTRLPEDCSG